MKKNSTWADVEATDIWQRGRMNNARCAIYDIYERTFISMIYQGSLFIWESEYGNKIDEFSRARHGVTNDRKLGDSGERPIDFFVSNALLGGRTGRTSDGSREQVNRDVSSSPQQGVKGALPNLWQNSRKSLEEKGSRARWKDGASRGVKWTNRGKGGKMTARLSNGSIYLLAVGTYRG